MWYYTNNFLPTKFYIEDQASFVKQKVRLDKDATKRHQGVKINGSRVPNLLERSSKRDRDVAEGVDDVRAAQVPGEENEAGVYTKAQ